MPMRRVTASVLNVLIVMLVAPLLAQPPAPQRPQMQPAAPGEPERVPLELFQVPAGFEVTLWASTPMLHNPTNMDIDKDGRIWVAEGVRYRSHYARQPDGDRIVVLQDTDGDGKADAS